MSRKKLELSRRKTLAALGAIGAASAGAGFGTSALFNDQESFENNRLVAGSLDLKVDWEEHYSTPQLYEGFDGDPEADLGVTREEPGDTADYTALPDPENPMLWVPTENLDTYMDRTAIDAYPDTDDDGTQEPFAAEPGTTTGDGVGYICADGADTPEDMDPTVDGALRTNNDDTVTDAGDPAPLVNLGDVKPGDFGELTLSFHLCDNPGYVWLNGSLTANAENDVTEPEADDPDENNSVGYTNATGDGELLDAVRTRLWYDDGDNVVEVGQGEIPDDPEYLTPELSLGELLLFLEGGDGIKLCAAGGGTVVEPPTGTSCPNDGVDSTHTTGDTVTVDTPLTDGAVDFTIPQNPKCTDFGLLQALKIGPDEDDGELPSDGGSETYSTPYGDIIVSRSGERITSWSIDSEEWCVAKVVVKGGNAGANVYSYDNGNGNDDFTDDTDDGQTQDSGLSLQTPTDQDISHVSFCVKPGTTDDGGGPDPKDCCFEASTDHYIGLAWWLPSDVGNEVQSDSVGFDLGFSAEQCRHNADVDLSNGLIAHYPLDDVSDGIADDASGNGFDGTVQGATVVSGIDGNAASFDGSDSLRVSHTGELTDLTDFTASAWFRSTEDDTGDQVVFGLRHGYEIVFDSAQQRISPDDSVWWAIENGTGDWAVNPTGAGPLGLDEWHHAALVQDTSADEVRVYVDGSLVATDSGTGSVTATTGDLGIGSRGDGFGQFVGDIDDVRIYGRALSASEIAALASP